MDQHAVLLALELGDDLAVGIDDHVPPIRWWPSSSPALATATTQVEFW